MSILFTTGTINQPDAGSVGLAMAEKIRDDLVAHTAWDLVEEFTASGGAVRWYVFKCLASVSGLDDDFFVVMGRTLSTGELRFAIGESYNTSGKVFGQYGPIGQGSFVTLDSLGRHTTTFTLGTAQLSTSQSMGPACPGWAPSGTSTKWWLTAAEDGFTVAFNGAVNQFVHLGAYIPLTPLEIGTPLQIMGSSPSAGSITRNPSVADSSIVPYCLTFSPANITLGFAGDLRYNDKLQSDQRPVAELAITLTQWNNDSRKDYGYALGKHKRMRVASVAVPAGMAFGDAYALSGTLWVPYLPSDLQIWDTGVASS